MRCALEDGCVPATYDEQMELSAAVAGRSTMLAFSASAACLPFAVTESSSATTISAVIPTFRRERVLIETIDALRALPVPPDEIVVVDQTEQHETATQAALDERASSGAIRLLRLQMPSIPQAMNRGLLAASGEVVLFLDDDLLPDAQLIAAHRAAHATYPGALIAGRVLQPWHEGKKVPDAPFSFACTVPQEVVEFMGGNFSVVRAAALALGGFDENFVKVAYRFEAEFAHRWRAAGHSIRFEPGATIHHLKVASGGTRTFGEHLTTVRPDHAVGAYYFIFRTEHGAQKQTSVLRRLVRAAATRHHLRQPWWIPLTLVAEFRALRMAARLARNGPALIREHAPGAGQAAC